jgi:type II secretory pathway predicted ATPase ExeA
MSATSGWGVAALASSWFKIDFFEAQTQSAELAGMTTVRAAVAQAVPVAFNLEKTLDKTDHLLGEAATTGAEFVVLLVDEAEFDGPNGRLGAV